MANLKKGFLWNALSAVGRQGAMMLGTIILARLLTPEDYGLIGMIAIFITVSETLIDAGLGGALIKKQEVKQVDYDTLTTYNVFVSILLYVCLYFIAPFISAFYDKTILTELLRLYGLTIVIESFAIGPKIYMMKNLYFKEYAITNLVAGIVGLTGAIICAIIGLGVFSLVAQYLFMAFAFLVLSLIFTRYSFHFGFSMPSFKELFAFGFYTTLSNTVKNFSEGIFTNYYAKFAPLVSVGYYNQATKLQGTVFSLQNSVIDSFIFPVLCSNKTKDRKTTNQINGLVTLGIIVLNSFLIINSEQIINIVLGEKWLPMNKYFCIMLTIAVFQARVALNRTVLKALGAVEQILRIEIYCLSFVAISLSVSYLLCNYEIVIYGLFLYSLSRLCISWLYLYKNGMFNFKEDVVDFLIQIAICFIPIYVVKMANIGSDLSVVSIIVKTSMFLLMASVMLYAFKIPSFVYLMKVVKRK